MGFGAMTTAGTPGDLEAMSPYQRSRTSLGQTDTLEMLPDPDNTVSDRFFAALDSVAVLKTAAYLSGSVAAN